MVMVMVMVTVMVKGIKKPKSYNFYVINYEVFIFISNSFYDIFLAFFCFFKVF